MQRTSMSLVLLPNCVVKKLPLTFVELPTVRCVGSSLSGRIVSAISATAGAVSVCISSPAAPTETMSSRQSAKMSFFMAKSPS